MEEIIFFLLTGQTMKDPGLDLNPDPRLDLVQGLDLDPGQGPGPVRDQDLVIGMMKLRKQALGMMKK